MCPRLGLDRKGTRDDAQAVRQHRYLPLRGEANPFYTEAFGCKAAPLSEDGTSFGDSIGDVAFYIFETSATNEIGHDDGMLMSPVGVDYLEFETADDFEAAQADLEFKGVTWLDNIVGEPGGFHDPDGNMLYVIHRR